MGITGDLAFAAGSALLAMGRHSPALRAEALIYADDALKAEDAALLSGLGARILPPVPLDADLAPDYLARMSPLIMTRFEGLRLLRHYRKVLFVDVDIAVQGDITPLLDYGPFGVALEDTGYLVGGHYNKAGVNITAPIPGYDAEAHNINAGVLALHDSLPDPEGLYQAFRKWLKLYARNMLFPDQAIINLMAHRFLSEGSGLVSYFPAEIYNAHPCNPKAQDAVLVHAFGEFKFWNDRLMGYFFPEWKRDYARWLASGGSPWRGEPVNAALAGSGPYEMIKRLLESLPSRP